MFTATPGMQVLLLKINLKEFILIFIFILKELVFSHSQFNLELYN